VHPAPACPGRPLPSRLTRIPDTTAAGTAPSRSRFSCQKRGPRSEPVACPGSPPRGRFDASSCPRAGSSQAAASFRSGSCSSGATSRAAAAWRPRSCCCPSRRSTLAGCPWASALASACAPLSARRAPHGRCNSGVRRGGGCSGLQAAATRMLRALTSYRAAQREGSQPGRLVIYGRHRAPTLRARRSSGDTSGARPFPPPEFCAGGAEPVAGAQSWPREKRRARCGSARPTQAEDSPAR